LTSVSGGSVAPRPWCKPACNAADHADFTKLVFFRTFVFGWSDIDGIVAVRVASVLIPLRDRGGTDVVVVVADHWHTRVAGREVKAAPTISGSSLSDRA
jgi:hypothetical protein